MKKSLTKLLIIAIICLIISGLFIRLSMNEFTFTFTEQVKEEFNEMDKDNPGAGWYLLIVGGTAFTTDLFLAFAYAILLGVPLLTLIIIVLLQIIARLMQIGEKKKWKDTTSKVFTSISIVVQILLCVYLLFIMICGFMINKLLLALVLALNITSVVLFIKELRKVKKNNTENKTEVIEEK